LKYSSLLLNLSGGSSKGLSSIRGVFAELIVDNTH
jgi:hypothetical protein